MTKKELKELIKETISEGFFDDMDAAADDRRQQLQNNPPLVYNITTKKVGNKLNISLTIDDYNQLKYVDNGRVSNKLDVVIQREIEKLIEEIADYNTKTPKKV
jgi:membrane peptidoglycan carboxypeptidase